MPPWIIDQMNKYDREIKFAKKSNENNTIYKLQEQHVIMYHLKLRNVYANYHYYTCIF